GRGPDKRRQASRFRQKARRSPGGDCLVAQDGCRSSSAVQQFPRLTPLSAGREAEARGRISPAHVHLNSSAGSRYGKSRQRSEERRVGKGCRTRRTAAEEKNNT